MHRSFSLAVSAGIYSNIISVKHGILAVLILHHERFLYVVTCLLPICLICLLHSHKLDVLDFNKYISIYYETQICVLVFLFYQTLPF